MIAPGSTPIPTAVRAMHRVLLLVALGTIAGAGPVDAPPDDATFRPTVVVRHAAGQGSGTVIASVPGQALVLTAAHVVEGARGGLRVDFHRYNLGVERTASPAAWPVSIPAEVVAADAVADVAVLRLKGNRVLPHVALLAPPGDEPADGAVVTSVGIDGGDHLSSWVTRVSETARMAMASPADEPPTRPGAGRAPTPPGGQTRTPQPTRRPTGTRAAPSGRLMAHFDGDVRPFVLTERAPVPGRSGGGLFDARGALVGVCVGRVEGGHDRGHGLFASGESAWRLLRAHGLDAIVARSEQIHAPASPAR